MSRANYLAMCPNDFLKYFWVLTDHILEQEDTQRHGVVFMQKLEGSSTQNYNISTSRILTDALQNHLPLRFAGVFLINPPLFYKAIFAVVRVFF
eukprot:m.12636 g.12636  ORF g.12636 m.12636 type:complete len:94 (-) comp9898_c0_seq2:500-781(-)